MKAVAITARDKAKELEGIGEELDAEYTKRRVQQRVPRKLQGSDEQIAATLQEVIDYTPDTGGGVGGHVEDSNAEDYFNDVKSKGALHTLTLPAKQRLVEHVLTGATLGSEDAMIVDLLAANVDDGVKIIKHFGWRWIWDDVDGETAATSSPSSARPSGPRATSRPRSARSPGSPTARRARSRRRRS